MDNFKFFSEKFMLAGSEKMDYFVMYIFEYLFYDGDGDGYADFISLLQVLVNYARSSKEAEEVAKEVSFGLSLPLSPFWYSLLISSWLNGASNNSVML